MSVGAVVVASLDAAQTSVGEVQLLSFVVDGEAVGGEDVGAGDDPQVVAGQGRPHDAGPVLVPVGPKHQAAAFQKQAKTAKRLDKVGNWLEEVKRGYRLQAAIYSLELLQWSRLVQSKCECRGRRVGAREAV